MLLEATIVVIIIVVFDVVNNFIVVFLIVVADQIVPCFGQWMFICGSWRMSLSLCGWVCTLIFVSNLQLQLWLLCCWVGVVQEAGLKILIREMWVINAIAIRIEFRDIIKSLLKPTHPCSSVWCTINSTHFRFFLDFVLNAVFFSLYLFSTAYRI